MILITAENFSVFPSGRVTFSVILEHCNQLSSKNKSLLVKPAYLLRYLWYTNALKFYGAENTKALTGFLILLKKRHCMYYK